tara:strand:- start:286 stop:525 length:240 start_codon:yes stop_codon:yes gene_type:complete
MTYQRNGRMDSEPQQQAPQINQEENVDPAEKPYRVHGFEQIIEMLHIADPEFRNSLLRRIENQNPELALSLKKALSRTP